VKELLKYALLVLLAGVMFYIRPDAGRDWTLEMLLHHTRFWYIPALAVILYTSKWGKR